MVLYVIGLGLGDEKDITVRGLEAVKKCKKLFLEYYTSILGIDNNKLTAFYGVPVVLADRNMVESEAEQIYEPAISEDIGLLVVGDPLCATTHTDIILRARDLGIKVEVIHNTSVMGAAASCGLQLYKFGYTISIPYFEGSWRPASFYHRIKFNTMGGMHTLCLLDIKVKEPDYDAMCSGKLRYLPPRFMTINQAVEQLLEVENKFRLGLCDAATTMAVGMARLGQPTQLIVYGSLEELRYIDFGPPLHSLALVCKDLKQTALHTGPAAVPSSGAAATSDAAAGAGVESAGAEEEAFEVGGVHPIELDYLAYFSVERQRDRIQYINRSNSDERGQGSPDQEADAENA